MIQISPAAAALAALLFLAPTLVALCTRHPNLRGIALANVTMGWTLFVLPILVMAAMMPPD